MGMFDGLRGNGANISHDRVDSWAGQDLRDSGSRQPAQRPGDQQIDPNKNKPPTGADSVNDTGNDGEALASLWLNKTKEPNKDQIPNNQEPANTPPAKSSKEQIDEYLAGVGLTPITMEDADVEAFKNDPRAFLAKMNDRIIKSHIEAIKGANKIIETSVEAAVRKAVAESKGFIEGKELQGLLRAKFDWAKDPAIAPVAETVMQRFLDKGATREEALTNTGKWFAHVGKSMDPEFNPNPNTGDSYRRTPQQPEEDTNWLELLKGK